MLPSRQAVAPFFILLASSLCLFIAPAYSDFSGFVVSVLDGDTLEVLHNDRPERIRLSGIDCPEKGQAIGNLEQSFPDANLRALIQMATGPGCT